MTVDTDPGLNETPASSADDGTLSAIGRVFAPVAGLWNAATRPIYDALNKLSLFSKIILLNLLALAGLIGGILYINQHEAWLITAKRDALEVQGKIIAEAISGLAQPDESTPPDSDVYSERLPQPPLPLSKTTPSSATYSSIDFTISPDKVDPLLGRLLARSGTRGRLWDPSGVLISDSQRWTKRFYRKRLPPIEKQRSFAVLDTAWNWMRSWFSTHQVEKYVEHGEEEGMKYGVVAAALASGSSHPTIMIDSAGTQIVGVAVPIKRQEETLGALFLTTKSGALDALITREKYVTAGFVVTALLAMFGLSLALRTMIVGPAKQLSTAADQVRESLDARNAIPEFPGREDEIGHLANAFRDMTMSLLKRIDDGERFAADVSHELKNPLTAVRSAAESLSKATRQEDREMLIGNIIGDVDRLNRLITDISNATRLDAEMALTRPEQFDLFELLASVIEMLEPKSSDTKVTINLDHQAAPLGTAPFRINGHPDRIAQVFTNLIDNALSFSPEGSTLTVRLARSADIVRVEVEDQGPGIPDNALEKVFRRFYTDRASTEWGDNSGLGLSISQDIVEAHRGRIWAENRISNENQDARKLGARFVVELPTSQFAARRSRAKSQARN